MKAFDWSTEQIFYWTHLLCIPFYTLLILHGANVWKWIAAPLVIFSLELAWRLAFVCSGNGRSSITSVALLANQVRPPPKKKVCLSVSLNKKNVEPKKKTIGCTGTIAKQTRAIERREPFELGVAPGVMRG